MNQGGIVPTLQLLVSGATLFAVVGIGARLVLAGGAAPDVARSPIESLRNSAYTNAEAAHITVTNDGFITKWACFHAVISSTASGKTVTSVPVCTGDVKPHSTVVLEAPFPVGSVEKLCPSDDSSFHRVDWSKCEFTVEDEK